MLSQPSRFLAVLLVFSLIPTIACISAASRRDKQWKKDFTYVSLVRTQLAKKDNTLSCATDYMTNSNLTWLQKAQCYTKDPSSSITQTQKAQLRNSIIENFLALADKDFNDFEGLTTVNRNVIETGFEFINLGLTAATAVVGLGQTLGAAATGTQGAQHSFDKNFYNSQTAYVINNKMEELRLEQLAKIRRREAEPVACSYEDTLPKATASSSTNQNQGSELPCYSLEEALGDVQEYFYDGTTHKALQALITQTATQANTAKQALTTPNSQRVSNPQPNPQINPVPPAPHPEGAPAPAAPPGNTTPPPTSG